MPESPDRSVLLRALVTHERRRGGASLEQICAALQSATGQVYAARVVHDALEALRAARPALAGRERRSGRWRATQESIAQVEGGAQQQAELAQLVPGCTVVVTADAAELRRGRDLVAVAKNGRWFGVTELDEQRVGVQVYVDSNVVRGWVRRRDVAPLVDDDIDLGTQFLLVAGCSGVKGDAPALLSRIDEFASRAGEAMAVAATAAERATCISRFLFRDEGFTRRKPEGHPLDRPPFDLDTVLREKRGCDWELCLLYLCIAQRAGLSLHLATLKEQPFAYYDGGDEKFVVDAARGGAVYPGDGFARMTEAARPSLSGAELRVLTHPQATAKLLVQIASHLLYTDRVECGRDMSAWAVEINPSEAVAYWQLAHALPDMASPGDTEPQAHAYRLLAMAVEADPTLSEAYSAWAEMLWEAGDLVGACERFAQAAQADPQSAETYHEWGLALSEGGQHSEACERYRMAAELYPKLPGVHWDWAQTLCDMERHDEACERYSVAEELDPWEAQDLVQRALAAIKSSERDEGTGDWFGQQCLQIVGIVFAQAYRSWGMALLQLDRPAEACQKFEKVVAFRPDDEHVYSLWGYALWLAGDPIEACVKFAEAAGRDPSDSFIYVHWGRALARSGREGEALEKLKRAVRLDPERRKEVQDEIDALAEWCRRRL